MDAAAEKILKFRPLFYAFSFPFGGVLSMLTKGYFANVFFGEMISTAPNQWSNPKLLQEHPLRSPKQICGRIMSCS